MNNESNRVLAYTLGRELTSAELELVSGAATGTAISGSGVTTCDNDDGDEVECK